MDVQFHIDHEIGLVLGCSMFLDEVVLKEKYFMRKVY